MIPVTEYRNETVAVFGLGRAGLATVQALAAGGAVVLADDDCARRREEAAAFGARPTRLTEDTMAAARALVLSPGVPLDHPTPAAARAAGVEIVGETELFARTLKRGPAVRGAQLVGVTGTNGKSTTIALIGHLLRNAGRPVRIGGNFGTAALGLEPVGEDGVYALEMSSFQLDLTENLVFDVAGLINISPDHLDRHGDMERYTAAKARIFRGQTRSCTAVIGCDDERSSRICQHLSENGTQRTVGVSGVRRISGGVGVQGGQLIDDMNGTGRVITDLRCAPTLAGRPNHQNAAAAYAICRALGMDAEAFASGLFTYPGLAHRLETVAEIAGVRYINDSKATNVMAAAGALAGYDTIYWIAGGRAKDTDLGPVAPFLRHVRHAYLIGEAAAAFAQSLAGAVTFTLCETLDRAVAMAARQAADDRINGAVVLLSPACASYDQFRDFEQRGAQFRALVESLAGEGA